MTLARAYVLTGVRNPQALYDAYVAIEQPLFIAGVWDYNDPTQLHNQIKQELEEIDPDTLNEAEREQRQRILWFWHHHAISCAIWIKQDRVAARAHATIALSYQDDDDPNQITRLLYFLVHDQLAEAEAWVEQMTDVEDREETARPLLQEYKSGEFF